MKITYEFDHEDESEKRKLQIFQQSEAMMEVLRDFCGYLIETRNEDFPASAEKLFDDISAYFNETLDQYKVEVYY